MSDEKIRRQLREFNAIFKETDAIYSRFAKRSGLSDCAFWLLYSVREADGNCTQKEICGQWAMNKQTVNSALKVLEKRGFITLVPSETDKRSRYIVLTEQGERFALENIDIIFQLEQLTLQKMTDTERDAMIEINRRYYKLFEAETRNIVD